MDTNSQECAYIWVEGATHYTAEVV